MKIILAMMLLAFTTLSANAQSAPPADAYAYFTVSGNQSNGFFKVTLPAVTNISSIKVRLGTAETLNDLIDYEFVFDVSIGLPGGYSFSRTDDICILGVGSFTEPSTTFGSVSLKDGNGNWSDPVQFISN